MRIYVDFDDVICETAKRFSELAQELFGIRVPYSEVQFFNLQKTFDLSDAQYGRLMEVGHLPENLLIFEETPGASAVINQWVDEGHDVSVITGRPFAAYDASREWLDRHGLNRVPLFCVDKYGREDAGQAYTYTMTLKELYRLTFDLAVEDSPAAFRHVLNFKNCTVAVFDRPWNRQAELPDERFVRCAGWREIDEVLRRIN